jgi:hypothetical protein
MRLQFAPKSIPVNLELTQGYLRIVAQTMPGPASPGTDGQADVWDVELANERTAKRFSYQGTRVIGMGAGLLLGTSLRDKLLHVIDAGSGQMRMIDVGQRVFGAAIAGARAIVVLATVQGPRIRSFRLPDWSMESETAFGLTDLPAVLIACPTADRCVVSDHLSPKLVRLKVGEGSLSVEPPIELSGPAVRSSIEEGTRRNPAPGRGRMGLISAYAGSSANGNDLFVVIPFNAREGLRLVEFDASGREVRIIHLKAAAQTTAFFLPHALAWDGTTIVVPDRDGTIHFFERP